MDAPSRRYQEVMQHFRSYASAERIELTPLPATMRQIEEAEQALGAVFPNSFRWYQLEFGYLRRSPLEIYGVHDPEPTNLTIVGINIDNRTELYPRLPIHLIAFSDSGGGDLLCFDTSRREGNECPVVWWDHENDEEQEPEEAAPSFLDWMESELRELAAEERGSLLDNLPYKHWIDTWFRRDKE